MEKTVRITKVQRFNDIIAMLNGEAVKYGTDTAVAVDFINHEIDLLQKKNASVDKRKAAEDEQNARYKSMIVDFLAGVDGNGMTCTNIGKSIAELSDFNTSKMSSLCNGLVKDGVLTKSTDKGKTLFKLSA